MKKNELMNGDIVVLRSGYLAVVIGEGEGAYLLFQKSGFEELDPYYNDDMVNEFEDDAIMQVFRSGMGFDGVDEECPIYERDDTWIRPSEEELKRREEEARIRREAELERQNAEAEAHRESLRKDNIFIISQYFYGNRTGTEINRDEVDYFLRGHISQEHFKPEDIQDVNRKFIRVPGSEYIVIVYDQTQEDRYVNIEFPEIYAMDGAKYLERWGEELKMQVSCEIPEIGFKIHTRCFACRMDENGALQSLEGDDYKQFIHYFPAR